MVNLEETSKTDTDIDEVQVHEEKSDALKNKIVVLERRVKETEDALTIEKANAKIAVERARGETAEYKLKVETLESEIAKLREDSFIVTI